MTMKQQIDYERLVKEAIKALDSFYGGDTTSKYIYGSNNYYNCKYWK